MENAKKVGESWYVMTDKEGHEGIMIWGSLCVPFIMITKGKENVFITEVSKIIEWELMGKRKAAKQSILLWRMTLKKEPIAHIKQIITHFQLLF